MEPARTGDQAVVAATSRRYLGRIAPEELEEAPILGDSQDDHGWKASNISLIDAGR